MRLSVALCTYNGARFLPEQLASLARQTRPPDELVVCDDRSSDDTVSLLGTFAATAPFPVHVHENPTTLGPTKNFEAAVERCTGDAIALCDQDDAWRSDKLARLAAALAEPGVGLAFSDASLADVDLTPTGETAWGVLPFTPGMRRAFAAGRGAEVLLRYNVVTGAALAFQADLRDVLLPIPACWHHDAWIAFLAAAVADVRLLPEPLVTYRQHVGQQVGLGRRSLGRQLRAAFTRIDAAYFGELANRFERLAERLETVRPRLRDPRIVDLTRERAAFVRSQYDMRQMQRLWRAAVAWNHLRRGRYHRFGHGLRAFAVDVLL